MSREEISQAAETINVERWVKQLEGALNPEQRAFKDKLNEYNQLKTRYDALPPTSSQEARDICSQANQVTEQLKQMMKGYNEKYGTKLVT